MCLCTLYIIRHLASLLINCCCFFFCIYCLSIYAIIALTRWFFFPKASCQHGFVIFVAGIAHRICVPIGSNNNTCRKWLGPKPIDWLACSLTGNTLNMRTLPADNQWIKYETNKKTTIIFACSLKWWARTRVCRIVNGAGRCYCSIAMHTLIDA